MIMLATRPEGKACPMTSEQAARCHANIHSANASGAGFAVGRTAAVSEILGWMLAGDFGKQSAAA